MMSAVIMIEHHMHDPKVNINTDIGIDMNTEHTYTFSKKITYMSEHRN
jgi:hypothetical protein